MANDFLSKYSAKGGDDLEAIAQNAPPTAQEAPPASVAPDPTTLAEIAQERPAAAQGGREAPNDTTPQPAGSLHYAQDANNGFTPPPASTAASAASYAAPRSASLTSKTVLGVPVLYIGIALASILAIVLAVFLLGRGKELPSMSGWSTSEAEFWASENKVNVRVEKLYSDEISSGTVISQTPAAGERIGNGEFLTITVSDGPDLSILVPVPDIMNMTMAEVEAWADANFMTTVRITTQTSETVASGKVISFTVNDNTVLEDEIRRDTPFYVVFSKGKPVGEAVELPNFLTMSVAEAEAFALEKELTLVLEEEFSDTVSEGNVIRQDVKAGENVYAGDVITLTVSKGKEIRVPDFASLSRELAAATASGLGIQTLIEETYSTEAKDVLLSQSAAAGSLYQQDDIVVLRYSKGNVFMITSFVGQSETELYAWRDGLNADGAQIQLTVTYTESATAFGTVLDQSHENVNVGIDAHLYFIVSSGTPVTVPSFVQPAGAGYGGIITKADVIASCNALGIVPYFEEGTAAGRLPGEVWYQSITAGQTIMQGQSIIIKIVPESAAATLSVPNFSGKTLAEAKAVANYAKFTVSYQDESGAALSESQIADTDTVKAQSVAANSSVKEGYAIVLTMQSAAAPVPDPDPTVPNFVGLTYDACDKANADIFVLKYEDKDGKQLMEDASAESNILAGDTRIVLTQSVAAYGQAPAGNVIILTMVEKTSD